MLNITKIVVLSKRHKIRLFSHKKTPHFIHRGTYTRQIKTAENAAKPHQA